MKYKTKYKVIHTRDHAPTINMAEAHTLKTQHQGYLFAICVKDVAVYETRPNKWLCKSGYTWEESRKELAEVQAGMNHGAETRVIRVPSLYSGALQQLYVRHQMKKLERPQIHVRTI